MSNLYPIEDQRTTIPVVVAVVSTGRNPHWMSSDHHRHPHNPRSHSLKRPLHLSMEPHAPQRLAGLSLREGAMISPLRRSGGCRINVWMTRWLGLCTGKLGGKFLGLKDGFSRRLLYWNLSPPWEKEKYRSIDWNLFICSVHIHACGVYINPRRLRWWMLREHCAHSSPCVSNSVCQIMCSAIAFAIKFACSVFSNFTSNALRGKNGSLNRVMHETDEHFF